MESEPAAGAGKSKLRSISPRSHVSAWLPVVPDFPDDFGLAHESDWQWISWIDYTRYEMGNKVEAIRRVVQVAIQTPIRPGGRRV